MINNKRPVNKPHQTKIRTSNEDVEKINFCAKELGISKTDVIMMGVDKVYQEILRRKKRVI